MISLCPHLKRNSNLPIVVFQRLFGAPGNGEIEIERKFRVTDSIRAFCESNAQHKKCTNFVDTYYDNKRYALTSKDMWLRERSGKWELKQPASSAEDNNTLEGLDFYQELTDIATIQERVQKALEESIPQRGELVQWLYNRNITPFGRIETSRTRYSLTIPLANPTHPSGKIINQNVFIDIDNVKYDPIYIPQSMKPVHGDALTYLIGEIELAPPFVIQDRNQVMRDIFNKLQIDIKPVRGKLLEYLKVFHPHHFVALEESGQLASKGLSKTSSQQ